jgi:DnaK suppressor protein
MAQRFDIGTLRARLERRRDELRRLLDQLDTDPSGAFAIPVPDPLECHGGVEELELRAVERALDRIDDHSFGTCDQCGGPVEARRLQAVPWSRCCSDCIAFWEGELRTVDAEQASCADCQRGAAA